MLIFRLISSGSKSISEEAPIPSPEPRAPSPDETLKTGVPTLDITGGRSKKSRAASPRASSRAETSKAAVAPSARTGGPNVAPYTVAGIPAGRRKPDDLFDGAMETELAGIVERIAGASPEDEARLLDDLTRLAARVEHLQSATRFRFEAAEAYEALVNRRLTELREVRIPGLSTIEEFLHRRVAPAMATCRSASRRIGNLAARLTRASALLRTRVDIAREQQNQKLLEAMNRRGRLQLRLQQAVEGLSVVVITYYGVSLVGVLAKAAKAAGLACNPDLVMGIAAPFVAVAVFGGVHRVRKALEVKEVGS